jgi:hypothetical protein
VRSNDKKRGRLAAMRWVLHNLEYPGKDYGVVAMPDPLIVGPPEVVYESGEGSGIRYEKQSDAD